MNDTTPNPTNKFLNHLNNLIKLYGVDGPVHPTAITVDEGEWQEIKALIDEHAAKTLSADTLNSKYCALKESAAEVLTTGMCSFCVEHPDLGDFDMELCANGSQVPIKITEMILRFDRIKFNDWQEAMRDE